MCVVDIALVPFQPAHHHAWLPHPHSSDRHSPPQTPDRHSPPNRSPPSPQHTPPNRSPPSPQHSPIETPGALAPWRARARALAAEYSALGALDASPSWTQAGFAAYLTRGSAPWDRVDGGSDAAGCKPLDDRGCAALRRAADDYVAAAARLRAAASLRAAPFDNVDGGPDPGHGAEQPGKCGCAVYIIAGGAFVRESLAEEFPELAVFNLTIDAAFVAAAVPGFYLPTRRFAALTMLAPMRRAILAGGAPPDAAAAVRALLGLG
jgi:hypothetical protein